MTPGTEPTTAADTESKLTGINMLVIGENTLTNIRPANPENVLSTLFLTGYSIPEKAFTKE